MLAGRQTNSVLGCHTTEKHRRVLIITVVFISAPNHPLDNHSVLSLKETLIKGMTRSRNNTNNIMTTWANKSVRCKAVFLGIKHKNMFKCRTVLFKDHLLFFFSLTAQKKYLHSSILCAGWNADKNPWCFSFQTQICCSGSWNMSFIYLQRCVLWYSVTSGAVQRLVTKRFLYELCCWLFICIF